MIFEVIITRKTENEVLVKLLEFKALCVDGLKLIAYPRRNATTISLLKLAKEREFSRRFKELVTGGVSGIILKSEVHLSLLSRRLLI